MTIAEFDKLHDMLQTIHEENIMIMNKLYDTRKEEDELTVDFFRTAFENAEKGRLQKWLRDESKFSK
jgi:hypothetical protein